MNPTLTPPANPGYDPNEFVTLTNSKTKEVRRVKRADLAKYDLPPTYQSQSDIYAKAAQSGNVDITNIPEDYRGGAVSALNSSNYAPVSTTEKQTKETAKAALKNLDTLEGHYNKSSATGPIGGLIPSKIQLPFIGQIGPTNPLAQDAASYDTLREGLAYQLASVIAGQTGQALSDKDKAAFLSLLPARSDSTEIAAAKMQDVRNLIANKIGKEAASNTTIKPKENGFASGDLKLAKDLINIPINAYQQAAKNPEQAKKDQKKLQEILTSPATYAITHPDEALQFGKELGQNVASDIGQFASDPAGTIYRNPVQSTAAILGLKDAGLAGMLKRGTGEAALPEITSAAAPTTSEATGFLPKIGANLRQNVRQIDTGPSIGGTAREARVNQTLDYLKIKGNAGQQYAQLEPKRNQLSDQIYSELSTNPKSVNIDLIQNDFQNNLQDQLRTKNLNSKTAKSEVSGYLADLYRTDKNAPIPQDISTLDLFELKKKINQDYQGVAKKLERGTPLTDREKVISAARQTIDDVIAQTHPSVKDATLMQSDLYDAAESLYKSRNKAPSIRAFGNNIPIPGLPEIMDFTGRTLQGK